jgi:hypothetical protein
VKAGTLRRLGHLSRTNETHLSNKLTFTRIEGTRSLGRLPHIVLTVSTILKNFPR